MPIPRLADLPELLETAPDRWRYGRPSDAPDPTRAPVPPAPVRTAGGARLDRREASVGQTGWPPPGTEAGGMRSRDLLQA